MNNTGYLRLAGYVIVLELIVYRPTFGIRLESYIGIQSQTKAQRQAYRQPASEINRLQMRKTEGGTERQLNPNDSRSDNLPFHAAKTVGVYRPTARVISTREVSAAEPEPQSISVDKVSPKAAYRLTHAINNGCCC